VTGSGDDLVAAERSRAFDLLELAGLGSGWTEEPVVPDPSSLGARDGFRLVASDRDVRLNVYVYDEWGAGAVAGGALQEMVDGGVYYARSTVNGRLLCFAVTDIESAPGRELVDLALGALAGWE
jgi:hypothetical protein